MTATATVPAPSIAYTGPWEQFLFREIHRLGDWPSWAELGALIEREQRRLRDAFEREYGPLADEHIRWVIDRYTTVTAGPYRRYTTRVSLLPLVASLPARPLPPDALTYGDDTEDAE